jgi:hypothetical protein
MNKILSILDLLGGELLLCSVTYPLKIYDYGGRKLERFTQGNSRK